MSFKDLIVRSYPALDEFKEQVAKILATSQIIRESQGRAPAPRAGNLPGAMAEERPAQHPLDLNLDDLRNNKESAELYTFLQRLSDNLYNTNAELAFQLHRDENSGNRKTLLNSALFWSIMRSVSYYHLQSVLDKKSDKDKFPGPENGGKSAEFFKHFTDAYNNSESPLFSDRQSCDMFVKEMKQIFRESLSSRLLMDSSTLVHCLLKSDPFLSKIQTLLQGLSTADKMEGFEIEAKWNKLKKSVQDTGLDLSRLLESGSNPGITRDLYELLYLKFRSSNSLDVVCTFLKEVNLISLHNICKGGIPYFQTEILNEIGAPKYKDLSLPDFMRSTNLHTAECVCGGNPNWLFWLTKVRDFANKCPEPAMQKFFAALVSDYSTVSEHTHTATEKLWNTLRSYLNHELIKRYILVRKILGERNMILFSEADELEELFGNEDCLTILSKIYGSSSSATYFNSKGDLFGSLEDIFEKHSASEVNSVEIYSVILSYMFLGGASQEGVIADALKPWMKHFTELLHQNRTEVLKERKRFKQHFITSSFLPLSLLFPKIWKEMHSMYTATVFDFKEVLETELDEHNASTFIVLLYSWFRRVPHLMPLENLAGYLATLKTEPAILFCRQKVESYFTIADAAAIINMAAELMKDTSNSVLIRSGTANNKDAGIQGWIWFMDTCKDKKDMLVYGLSQLRKYLISERYESAIDFCHNKLDLECNKCIDQLRTLRDSDSHIRSLLIEKEIYSRFLDILATHNNLFVVKSQLVQEKVFGISQDLNIQTQKRNLVVQLLKSLVTPEGSAIIHIETSSPHWQPGPRLEEVTKLKPVLVGALLGTLTQLLVPLPSDILSPSLDLSLFTLGAHSQTLHKENSAVFSKTVSLLAKGVKNSPQGIRNLLRAGYSNAHH